MSDWTNKVVLITGGSSGIGKATVEKFLKKKATVYILGRNRDKLESVRNELAKTNATINTIVADVAIPSECSRAIEFVLSNPCP